MVAAIFFAVLTVAYVGTLAYVSHLMMKRDVDRIWRDNIVESQEAVPENCDTWDYRARCRLCGEDGYAHITCSRPSCPDGR